MKKEKFKVTYLFVFLLAMGLAIGVVCSFMAQTKKDLSANNKQYLREISQQNAVAIEKVVELNLDKLSAIAGIVSHLDTCGENDIMQILSAEAVRASYKQLGFASVDGAAMTTDHQRFNIADREYFKAALQGKSGLSGLLVDKVDGQNIIVYAVPLYQNGDITGVLFATYSTELFADILATPLFGDAGYVYIITKKGEPIVYMEMQDGEELFNNVFNEIAIGEIAIDANAIKKTQENLQAGKSDIIEYSKNGTKVVAAYCKTNVNDWYVVSAVPQAAISENTTKILRRNAELTALVTLMVLGFIVCLFGQQKKAMQRLKRIAYFDELIGFPNYNSFVEKSVKTLAENPQKQFVFIILDVDEFKLINERLGFYTGDQVLKNIALAIAGNFSEPDEIFARISVDQYIIMVHYKDAEHLKNSRVGFERRFRELMGEDFNYYITFPTGRYITDPGETSFKQIYEKVNYAHHKAKQLSEKSGIYEFFYDNEEKAKALRKNDIENRMHAAITQKEFQVFLQPKYELKQETVVGAEALVRWQKADGTMVFPNEFIPIFEQNGFIVKLDLYMLESVCSIIRGWLDGGQPVVPISVNFSRLHLLDPDFIQKLVSITDQYQVPHRYIEIELTESIIFENEDLILEVLQQAHAFGFQLSMDDFGTGYSSLGLLKNLPVDSIKIDRSFFINNKYDERARNVIQVIMLMAHRLHARTVAEGVEDAELIDFLREVGCDIVQGYYYAKPMPLEEFNEKIAGNVMPDMVCGV